MSSGAVVIDALMVNRFLSNCSSFMFGMTVCDFFVSCDVLLPSHRPYALKAVQWGNDLTF